MRISGWLSPEGKYNECDYYTHMSCATNIVEEKYIKEFEANRIAYKGNQDTFLFAKGYMKFGVSGAYFPMNLDYTPIDITKHQNDFISIKINEFNNEQSKDISQGLKSLERHKRYKI